MKSPRKLILITLIIAGEAVFFLPFVLARIFRPTLLEAFQIDNTTLGKWFAAYGIMAMISYLGGGPLADRFPARRLMALALLLTSAGGFLMFFLPGDGIMTWVYIWWGLTTIWIFWAALIRATREWGRPESQASAFGWLEGGRGAVAALMGTLTFLVFRDAGGGKLPEAGQSWTLLPFQWVILAATVLTLLASVLVWVVVPDRKPEGGKNTRSDLFTGLSALIRLPSVWLLAGIIICAYSGYKATDVFSLYAREVLGTSELAAAGIGTSALWIRAIVAVAAGILGDRLGSRNVIIVAFAITGVCATLTGFGSIESNLLLVLINLGFTAAGIYAVRALYFSILREAGVPLALTGMAVGIVSFLGFTPEIFMSPWMGYLLDANPGPTGHRLVFFLLASFSFAGMILGAIFVAITRSSRGS